MPNKYIIYDPDTGEIVYMGGKPSEPLTPKKQALIDSGHRIKRIRSLPRKDHASDMAFMRYKNGRLEKKTVEEINSIDAKREQDSADRRIEWLRGLKSELETV